MDFHDPHQHHDGPDEGRAQAHRDTYRVSIGINGLRRITDGAIADPVPAGRQLLSAIGIHTPEPWALVAIERDGAMEEIRLDETVDLRRRGIERFVAFETDRLFRAFLKNHELLWGRRDIGGDELYVLSPVEAHEALYLDVPGGTDRRIGADTVIDLSARGVERIVVGPAPAPDSFVVVINYAGLEEPARVRPPELITAVITGVLPAFGNPGGDLVLVDPASGRELNPAHSVAQEHLQPGMRLQLRPRTVQGG